MHGVVPGPISPTAVAAAAAHEGAGRVFNPVVDHKLGVSKARVAPAPNAAQLARMQKAIEDHQLRQQQQAQDCCLVTAVKAFLSCITCRR